MNTPGYEKLAAVLRAAYEQASAGKGRERHASDGVPFEDQPISVINRTLGSIDGLLYQASKKAMESRRLPAGRAQAELLGAIVYLAGAVIALDTWAAGTLPPGGPWQPCTGQQHSDDEAVDRFAAAMKSKMARQLDNGYGGWDDPAQCPAERLQEMLQDHVQKGDPVDVGNFAMMLFNRGLPTAQPRNSRPATTDLGATVCCGDPVDCTLLCLTRLLAEAGADGWMNWPGGECQVKSGTLVEVQHRNGTIHSGHALFEHSLSRLHWFHGTQEDRSPHPADIVRFRIIPQPINN